MNKENDESLDKEFTAYIIRGNRQVIEREIKASRRFKIGDDTYVIKSDCIFIKKIDNKLKSISVYTEGNPNPHNFIKAENDINIPKYKITKDKETGIEKRVRDGKELLVKKGEPVPNLGLSEDELNDLYGGDMFNILIEGQQEDKMNYALLLIVLNLVICIIAFSLTTFGKIVFGV